MRATAGLLLLALLPTALAVYGRPDDMALSLLGNDFFADPFFRPFQLLASAPGGLDRDRTTADRQVLRGIPVDVVEKDKEYEIKADIPGVERGDIQLSVDGDVLTIGVEGEKAEEKDEDVAGVKVHRVERSTTFATRRLRLPDNADPSQITAKFENGTLKVAIPKAETKKTQQTIDVK